MLATNFRVEEHIVPAQHIREYPRATLNDDEDELKITVKQYTPLDNANPRRGDVTLLAAHANGVAKELYEPLWDDLYQISLKTGRFRIRSIWISDVAWQGWSSVLNEDVMGGDPSWFDHPRDMLQIVNHFRKQMLRPIFGVGHSMGGNQVINLAYMHPRLFSGLILFDPVVQRFPSVKGNYLPAFMSTFRRDIWPSREEAASSLRKNAFYQAWDPRCLELHIKYAFRELPTALHQKYVPRSGSTEESNSTTNDSGKPVTLTTTKHQEVMTFMRPNFPATMSEQALKDYVPDLRKTPDIIPGPVAATPFYRPEPLATFINLPNLRPRVLYVFPDESPVAEEVHRREKMEVTGTGNGGSGGKDRDGAVQQVVVKKAGHFITFEMPTVAAETAAQWLGSEMERWRDEDEKDRKEWEEVKKRDGGKGVFTLSPEYVEWMKFDRQLKQKNEAESKKDSKL